MSLVRVSRGRLLPQHHLMGLDEVPASARQALQDSLVLVHGGMAQNVGPLLEMVTERYLLRSTAEWQGRQAAICILQQVTVALRAGDIQAIGQATHRNFHGPIQTIIPWASNLYTERLIGRVKEEFGSDFWGFWMLGGMAGGGMGFLFHPAAKPRAQERLGSLMGELKAALETGVPFAMEPVVYDFSVNEEGTVARLKSGDQALLPAGYYSLILPALLRSEQLALSPVRRCELERFSVACRSRPELAAVIPDLFGRLVPYQPITGGNGTTLDKQLAEFGFDPVQHEQIRADLRSGRIGLAQNRLPANTRIEDARPDEVVDATHWTPDCPAAAQYATAGKQALAAGEVAVVTLGGGSGSRWTQGAGVVKAVNPFCRLGGRYRTFLEVHLAKSRRSSRLAGCAVPHLITTSYLTGEAIEEVLAATRNYEYPGMLMVSPGRGVGLRLVPMARDLRFAWEETPQQLLDEQAQKVRASFRRALVDWAEQAGEGSDYRDNEPRQCLHPVGHWFEVPNLLVNGTLERLLQERPQLRHLLVHNVDTVGACLDAALLGYHLAGKTALTFEVTTRRLEDRGGGLARVDGHLRLIEGLALPREEAEFSLSYYNTLTNWVDVDRLLCVFGLTRSDLADRSKVTEAVRSLARRMPTYVTLKEVKRRWGQGQEDVFPVAQFERLWGDMSALPEVDCRFVCVPRVRGQQLKEVSQLDGWLRDGSAAHIEGMCEWGDVNARGRPT